MTIVYAPSACCRPRDGCHGNRFACESRQSWRTTRRKRLEGSGLRKAPSPPPTLENLKSLAEELAREAPTTTRRRAVTARQEIAAIVKRLERIMVELDTVRHPTSVFDPGNPTTIGRFAAIAMVAQERHLLDSVPPFYGSGVYGIYYDGPYRSYQPLVGTENPIYVGKADPAIASAKTPREQGQRLSGRLKDHARTIRKAMATLDLADFTCRFLVVQSGWQVAAETYLIELFKPVWNDETRICYGIGKHGDAPETRSNLRSPWDTLHAGRDWAHRDPGMNDAKPRQRIEADLVAHFLKHPPLANVDAVLKRFYDDLKQG